MLAVAILVLFGFMAIAALAQVAAGVRGGLAHGRAILAELAQDQPAPHRALATGSLLPVRQLAAA